MLELEARFNKDIRDILTEAYQQHGSNACYILGVSLNTMYRWFHELGLKPGRVHTVTPRGEETP